MNEKNPASTFSFALQVVGMSAASPVQGSRYPLGGFGYMIRAPKNTSDTGGSEGQKHVGAKLGSYSPSNQGKVAHAS